MKAKQKHCSEILLQFQGDTKKTWQITKEVIRKSKLIHSTLQCKFAINKNVITEEKQIANIFNNSFLNIGPNLADGISLATRSFESYFQKPNETIKDESITDELKDTFFSLKINKSAGYDKISFSVIKNRFSELFDPCK